MDRFELKDILDKAQIKYSLIFSRIYGSEYWTINGLYYRVSDHDKPKNNEQGYVKGINDFRNHDDLYQKLKERKDIDFSDKTDKESEYKSNLEDYIFKREDGIWEYDGHVYPILNSTKEGMLDFLWNDKEVLNFEKKAKDLISINEKGLFVTLDGRRFDKIEWALKYLWNERYDESLVPNEYINNHYKKGGYMENKKGVITGEFRDARYAKDKILYIPPISTGFTKNRESRLAEAVGVNGKYTHREKGYIMSKKQAERLKEHLIKGHDAEFISGEIIENTDEFAKGGKVKSTFEEKVKAISKRLVGQKVPKKYKKDYGATYDKAESKQAGRRIAGSQLVKLKEKMEKMRKAKKKS